MSGVFAVAVIPEGQVIAGEATARNATQVAVVPFGEAITRRVPRWACAFFLSRAEAERYAAQHERVANA